MRSISLHYLLYLMVVCSGYGMAQPLALHPENPHYLLYNEEPLLLVTSAEHYGALLNLDFDYDKYLQTLHEAGMNYTRIFTGSYVEVPGSFGIKNNSLSPIAGSFIAPWVRVSDPGLYEDEGKFDLDQWNPAYFERLYAFIRSARKHEVIVEITFFCATYQDAYWTRHPYNPENNVNDLGPLIRRDFNTLKNAKVLRYQKQLIEKLAIELNEYDHIFFELCNEPWADNGTHTQFLHKTLIPKNDNLGWFIWATAANADAKAWQRELAATFRNAEAKLGKKHLLAQNYSNFKENLTKVDPNIDILNFHYAWPESVSDNYAWNRPINFDESGFAGSADTTYLQQAWAFIMSGGSIFNNLDYSFYVGSEDGTGDNEAPGGGSTRLRMQLKFLHDFINRFDFVELIPSTHLVKHSPGMEAYGMAQRDQSYAFYLQGNSQGYFTAHVDSGSYEVKVFSPDTGMQIDDFSLVATDTPARIKIPRANRLAISLVKSVD